MLSFIRAGTDIAHNLLVRIRSQRTPERCHVLETVAVAAIDSANQNLDQMAIGREKKSDSKPVPELWMLGPLKTKQGYN